MPENKPDLDELCGYRHGDWVTPAGTLPVFCGKPKGHTVSRPGAPADGTHSAILEWGEAPDA